MSTQEKPLQFVDSHAHLPMLEHSPLQEILERTRKCGVFRQISVSTDPKNWTPNQTLANSNEDIFFSLGLHPHDAKTLPECQNDLQSFFQNGVPNKCVAIGEMGLDFYYNLSPKDAQINALEHQIDLAHQTELPLIIHCRDAFDELFQALRQKNVPKRGGVMHCFTGTTEQAHQALDLGLYISFSGILTFKNSTALRETAKTIPTEKILVETDCPFLTPVPHRGKPNEPSLLPFTAQILADTLGKSLAEIAETTTQNTFLLFGLR